MVVNYGPSGTFTGKAQVTFLFQSMLPQVFAWSFHTPLNPVITGASPTPASGDWYVHALGVYKTA